MAEEKNFKFWKEYHVDLQPGHNSYNLRANTSNVLKIINDNLLGSEVFASTFETVTESFYELKVDKASSSSIVRPEALGTVFFFNPSPNVVRVRMQEIETHDIAYIFNATNAVQITGNLDTNGLRAADLFINANRSLNVVMMNTEKFDTMITKMDNMITLLNDIKNKP